MTSHIARLSADVYLNLDSGLLVRLDRRHPAAPADLARVTTPCGYSHDLSGQVAADLEFHLVEVAVDLSESNEDVEITG